MAIRFRCANAVCRKPMGVPDDVAGRRAKCPHCGFVQVVEPPRSEAESLWPTVAPPLSPATEPISDLPPAWAGAVRPTESPTRRIAKECFRAIPYSFSNLKGLLGLILLGGFWSSVVALYRFAAVAFWILGCVGPLIGMVVGVTGFCFSLGFYVRYFMDVVGSSIEGSNQAPVLPSLMPRELFRVGFLAWGVFVVYIAPVITLPLLPLGVLALAFCDDERAFDVQWAYQTARRCRGPVLTVLGICLLLVVLAAGCLTALIVGAPALAAQLKAGDQLTIAATLVWFTAILAGVVLVVVCACSLARCVGVLGRYIPDELENLPKEPSSVRTVIFLGGGALASGLLWTIVSWILIAVLS